MRKGLLALLLLSVAGAGVAEQRFEDVERVVAFGDVHGAYDELVSLLQSVGVVDASLKWVGGSTHLVSLGDLLDRGPDSRRVMDLLMRLEGQASASGGRVHVVLGNHEAMNLLGDLRYLTREDYAAFASDETPDERAAGLAALPVAEGETADEPVGYFAYRAAFERDGKYGAWLLDKPAIVVIDDTAFLHGGLPTDIGEMTLAEVNGAVAARLGTALETYESLVKHGLGPPYADLAELAEQYVDVGAPQAGGEQFVAAVRDPILSEGGPLWYRGTALCHPLIEEPVLAKGLAALGVSRVVVGHTPTPTRRAMLTNDGRVVRLDTGMLAAYYKGQPAALVIEGGALTAHYLDGGVALTEAAATSPALAAALRDGNVEVTSMADVPWQATIDGDGGRYRAEFIPMGKRDLDRELAAQWLDAHLGFNLLPPVAPRKVSGKEGLLSYLPGQIVSEQDRVTGNLNRTNWCDAGSDYDLMQVLDVLIGNNQRNATNLAYVRADWRMRLTDHKKAFGTSAKLPAYVAAVENKQAPRAALDAVRALDDATLAQGLGDYLKPNQIKAIGKRRDAILEGWAAY